MKHRELRIVVTYDDNFEMNFTTHDDWHVESGYLITYDENGMRIANKLEENVIKIHEEVV